MTLRIDLDVSSVMRDGTVLRADVYRPDDGRPHPALLCRTPYGKGARAADLFDPVRAAAAGFAVVFQDVRGRWASEGGPWYPFRDEFDDGADSVQWCAAQDWCDGRVGTFGLSYAGFTSWAAAVAAPPALVGFAAAQTPHRWVGDLFSRGGALNLLLLAGWAVANGGLASLVAGALAGRVDPATLAAAVPAAADHLDALPELLQTIPVSAIAPLTGPTNELAPMVADVLAHPLEDDFTRGRSLAPRWTDVRVPGLVLAGWHDMYAGTDLEAFRALAERGATPAVRTRSRLVVGPWSHANFSPVVGDVDFGLRSSGVALDLAGDLTTLHLDWFGRLLAGDVDPDPSPAVRYFVQGERRWRGTSAWPPSGARRTLLLAPGGVLSVTPPEGTDVGTDAVQLVHDPAHPCPTVGGSLLPWRTITAGPLRQDALLDRADVAVFTSTVLAEPLEIVGDVSVDLYVSATAAPADWVVKLCEVDEDGSTRNVTDGVLRHREPAPSPVRIQVDLQPTAIVIPAGHRLRLLVATSDFPRYDRSPAGTQCIYVGGAHPSTVVIATSA